MMVSGAKGGAGPCGGESAGVRFCEHYYCVQMNPHITRNSKIASIGPMIGAAGLALAWNGYREVGLLLIWMGVGIGAYGVTKDMIEQFKRWRKNKD